MNKGVAEDDELVELIGDCLFDIGDGSWGEGVDEGVLVDDRGPEKIGSVARGDGEGADMDRSI